MALEKFIRGVIDGHRHHGKASEKRRLDAVKSAELCYKQEPIDQHITIFTDPYTNGLREQIAKAGKR